MPFGLQLCSELYEKVSTTLFFLFFINFHLFYFAHCFLLKTICRGWLPWYSSIFSERMPKYIICLIVVHEIIINVLLFKIGFHIDLQTVKITHPSAMAFLAHLIFIIQLLVAVSPSSMALKQCKVKTTSKPGFFLVGYALKSFTAERLAFCYSTCNTDPSCQSLNYNLASKTCQLNSESRKSKPDSFHASDGYVYSDNPDRGKSFKAIIW